MKNPLGYNERAWAIDVISEINRYCQTRRRAISHAGGEYGLEGRGNRLYPDVILFGNHSRSVIHQGWELKLPDTSINDPALLKNAEEKARRLGLSSFLVWNARDALLYLKDPADRFTPHTAWPTNVCITQRGDVSRQRDAWVAQLHAIIDQLNALLDQGTMRSAPPEDILNERLFVDLLDTHSIALAAALKAAQQRDVTFADELAVWWQANEIEFPHQRAEDALAQVALIQWINRLLFAHHLKRFNRAADVVDAIVPGTPIDHAVTIFETLTQRCDFSHVFRPTLGQRHLDPATWDALTHLNKLLKDFSLGEIEQDSLQNVIDCALSYARKKLAGQYSTPTPLADLLVRLTLKDRTQPVIDPCCGSGTLARAAYRLKRSVGLEVRDALATTWASDKFAIPLQLCSIGLSDPLGMGEVIQVFQQDALTLTPGRGIVFTEPHAGQSVTRELPTMHAVVSNLPFVRFEDQKALNPWIAQSGVSLDKRSDLYAYLTLKLKDLLAPQGRMGLISSNAWLGTQWGAEFKKLLLKNFVIRQVILCAQGRWFQNAEVVATALILEKREHPAQDDERIEFLTTTTLIDTWQDATGGIDTLARLMRTPGATGPGFTRQSYTRSAVDTLTAKGIGWNALFADWSWFPALAPHLVTVSSRFSVARGARRGWDEMFYPSPGQGIEPPYLQPVLKSARDIRGLIADADASAFCCSNSPDKLEALGHHGALGWIQHFSKRTNEKGKPLPEVLEQKDLAWFEMSPHELADLVISMNPDHRLCVHRLATRSFVNQRLIRLSARADTFTDIALCHALMNSSVAMLLIESVGFGRGLGALDLNARKISEHLHMLNPDSLTPTQRARILAAFQPLLTRDVCNLNDELTQPDRVAFDATVLESYGLGALQTPIRDTLLTLFHIRQTARMKPHRAASKNDATR